MEKTIGGMLEFAKFTAAGFSTKDKCVVGVSSKDALAGGRVEWACKQDMGCRVHSSPWSRPLVTGEGSLWRCG